MADIKKTANKVRGKLKVTNKKKTNKNKQNKSNINIKLVISK